MGKNTLKKSKNWYLLISGKELGPLSYEQILEKIRSGQVVTTDLIKAVNQESWGSICDHEIFNTENHKIESILESTETEFMIETNRRRHERQLILADVFVKKENNLQKVKARDIAVGGMSVLANEDFANEGSILSLYCSPVSESIAFNCVVKVMSKTSLTKEQYRYGLKFLKVSPKGQGFLDQLSKMEKKAS